MYWPLGVLASRCLQSIEAHSSLDTNEQYSRRKLVESYALFSGRVQGAPRRAPLHTSVDGVLRKFVASKVWQFWAEAPAVMKCQVDRHLRARSCGTGHRAFKAPWDFCIPSTSGCFQSPSTGLRISPTHAKYAV